MIALIALMSCVPFAARAMSLEEHALKAVYLYNFAKYTNWPPSVFGDANSPIHFCVIGAESVASELGKARDRPIAGHPIEVSVFNSLSQLTLCHVVYLGGETIISPPLLQEAHEKSILVVSDNPETSTITFVKSEAKIGFTVDLRKAQASALTLSSELMKLAIAVRGRGEDTHP